MGPVDPPGEAHYTLDECLELLAALEDARDALTDSDHLAVLAQLEHQMVVMNHKLRFDDPPGGSDGQ